MIIDILITFLACFIFLFIFWMRLKEDYTQNQIFTTGFYVLLGLACANILADSFFAEWWFWASFAGALLGLGIGVWRFRLRIFETLEASVLAGLVLFAFVYFSDLLNKFSYLSLAGLLSVLLFVGTFFFLDVHYKKFSWYKSGRVGFSGLTVSGLFFLTRTFVAMSTSDMLSFVGNWEVMISGIASFLSFMAVYNLSKQT